jgi:tripartite-type tricarboxylate transporter receptor subunit TctC
MNDRIARGLLLAVAAGALHGAAYAQDGWPSRPLRLISTSVAGGNIDVMCRIIAEKLSVRLGQPVVVDNKPGAATVLGTAEAAKAPPDGYTFLVTIMSSIAERLIAMGQLPIGNTPGEFAENYRRDFPRWEALIKASGAKVE